MPHGGNRLFNPWSIPHSSEVAARGVDAAAMLPAPSPPMTSSVAAFWAEVIREIQRMPPRMFLHLPLAKAGDLKTIQAYDAVATRWREAGRMVPAAPTWMGEFRVS